MRLTLCGGAWAALVLVLWACDSGGTAGTGTFDAGGGTDGAAADSGGIGAEDAGGVGEDGAQPADTATQDTGGSDGGTDAPDAAADVPTCEDQCPAAGALRCDGNGVQTCVETGGCLDWGKAEPCGELLCVDGHCALTCEDACAVVGEKQCDGNAVVTCKDYDKDGCLEWGGPVDCIGGTVCQGGFCSVGCAGTEECTVQGAKKCDGDSVVVCADLNFDGCLEWGSSTPCQSGLVCSGGSCASSCTDECTVSGARQCAGVGGWQECGEHDGDGCLEWGKVTACAGGDVCSSGFCSSDCVSECSVIGATKCSGAAVQTCGDSNGDGCLEWGTAVACASGQTCANGFCQIGCTDECTVKGAKTCDGNGYKVCGDADGNGCLEWGTVQACAAGQTCSAGSCSTSCIDECSVTGAKKCLGQAVQVCGNSDADPCLEWGTASPCGVGETCSNGFCGTTCTNECTTKGAKACEGGGVKTCDDFDQNGCLEWGSVVACEAGQSCSSGNCSSTCTDECSVVGAKKCDGSAVATCGNTDADPCLEWGTPQACAPGLSCSGGFCTATCKDECTVKGAKACEGAGTKVCGDANGDGCLEWGSVVPCEAGQSCSNGSCSSTCVDECTTAGAKACDGNGVKTCGNTDADPCLEWGTAVACDPGLTCSNGSCALGCKDECTVKGAKQCAGAAWQACDDHDQDGCLEWGTPTACGDGEICSAGSCALGCTSTCSVVGEKQCNVAGAVETCDDWNVDGCLEWGSGVACGPGLVCSAGNCATTCVDDCPAVGLVECTPTGNGTRQCGDWNQDGCLGWGTTVSCGQNQTCVAGECKGTAAPGKVVLNEVLYNAQGSDTTAFVELLGEPGLPLDGFSLVGINGANGQEYNVIALVGSIGDDGLFVVGKTGSISEVVAASDQISTLADYQNGPDSIQLRWGAQVVDAFGYGSFAGAIFAGEGAPAPVAPEGSSHGRDAVGTDTDDNSKDFHAYATWTPGAPNGAGNQPPAATLVCPPGGKTGASLSFDASGSSDPDGTIVGFQFTWGDGFQSAGPGGKVTHAFSQVGSFEVTVVVTDNQGATGVAACTVEITDANAPVVLITKPAADLQVTQGTLVAGITADVTPAPGRSIVKAELVADGVVVGEPDLIAPYVFDFTVPLGSLTDSTIALRVRATDNLGSAGSSAPRQLFVKNDKPVASFSAVISGNLLATVDATGSTDTETLAAALQVRWDWEDDGTFDTPWSTQKVENHQYVTDGAHTIRMEVRDAVGQVSSTTRTVNFQSVQDVSGAVTTTLWYGTINITGDTTVPAGQTLTIAKGTTVVFLEFDQNNDQVGDFDLTIGGTLVVQGTADEPVIFTTLDTNGKVNASSWNRVTLATGSGPHSIEHAVFEYGDIALEVRAPATLTDVELRNNRLGMLVGVGGVATLTRVNVHDSVDEGIQVSGGKILATDLTVKASGKTGVLFVNGTGSQIADCTVTGNGLHGFWFKGGTADIDGCAITSNGRTGVWFQGPSDGSVTHSTLRFNKQEGVRVTNVSNGNPTPDVQWNNIFENATEGSMEVVYLNKSVTSPYGSGDASVGAWTSPGGPALAAEVTYSEDTSTTSITGQLLSGSTVLQSYGSNTSLVFLEMPDETIKSLSVKVADAYAYGSGTMTLNRVAYLDPTKSRQLASLLTSGTVDARFNYLGAWPDALSMVSYQDPPQLTIQGFVGAPFDATWDPWPWVGGVTLTASTTWSGDVWVTGGVTVGSGATLTIAPGTTVNFVPTDQDGDGRGDWFIDRAAGTLSVEGAPGSPVSFDVEGTIPAKGGYTFVQGTGAGTTTMTHATLSDGWTCLRAQAGATNLSNVTVLDCREHGLHATGTSAVVATELLVDGAGKDAVRLEGTGARTFDKATLTGSGLWGLELDGATSTSNALTNATVQDNALGGVRVRKSHLALSASNVKLNGYGVLIQGTATGSVQSSNIQSNAREGVQATILDGANPTLSVTGNNIFGNATAWRTAYANAALSTTSPYGSGDSGSKSWSVPGAGHVLHFEASYSEDTSTTSISGKVYSGATTLQSFGTNLGLTFYDVAFDTYTALSIIVNDAYAYGSGTMTLARIAHTTPATGGTEMSGVLSGGTLSATGNYWGVTVPTATHVQEMVVGSINYTQFKTTPVAGTGPQ
ncbi:MAG: hypothetical protein AMXMBFR64_26040 [Myxococcales bacterium]